ncbi:hypothetical protein KK062_03635 [Fulvivirgaceae bacterium PWU5]|uniref:Uncharacterized protein n=1 Tax=Dawidia cretensis TaxID=2782350 RepID=A0AAP2GTF1_9BACT|nr:hypothetical protein [Dawidia cretensis]MBT1707295.1 hypothetical protein [Dawidia cretensis]
MSTYSIKDIISSSDRYKLYTLVCKREELKQSIDFLNSENIPVINVGKEVSKFVETLQDQSYINIDVFEYTKKLLDGHKIKLAISGNFLIAIHNIGILLEPMFKLNAAQMLREFSKSTALIIVWENELDFPNKLHWTDQTDTYNLDFLDTPLKKLHHAL